MRTNRPKRSTGLVLHIGTPKTGTTYLQGILARHREELAERGWSYPGQRENQQHAVYGICGRDIYYLTDTSRYRQAGVQLLTRLRTSPTPRTLWSAEVLAQLDDPGVRRLLQRSGSPDSVVMTVRGLHTLLPSSWQQLLKTGHTETLDQYLDRLETNRGDRASPAWRGYAFGDVVRRWSRHAPVHVVVVPPRAAGRDRLWQLFRGAVGLPELPAITVAPSEANVSLSTEAAEVLRRLSIELRKHGRGGAQQLRRHYLHQVVFPLADTDGGTPTVLPQEWHDRVRQWNAEELDDVARYAHVVHGDLDDAAFRPGSQPAGDPAAAADVVARQMALLLAAREQG